MDNIATTLACYGNLYLSNQLDIDEWIIYASQFQQNGFQFYDGDGKLFADYLAQWLECQKKRGVKQFFLQLPLYVQQAEKPNSDFHYIYRNEFSIVCRFKDKEEIWACYYPKTIATSSNLNLANSDSYAGHNCRPITYVLTKVNTILSDRQIPTDWPKLKTEIINSLKQLWPTDENNFSINNYYYSDRSNINEFPWRLPTLPPDENLIIPHQLLIGLSQLESTYENDTNGKNEGNAFYTLPKEELEHFLAHGELIKQWTKKVLLLASQETRWQISLKDLYAEKQKSYQTLNTNKSNQANIALEPHKKESPNSKKGCLILSLIIIAVFSGIGYALFNQFWLILSLSLLLYLIIKK